MTQGCNASDPNNVAHSCQTLLLSLDENNIFTPLPSLTLNQKNATQDDFSVLSIDSGCNSDPFSGSDTDQVLGVNQVYDILFEDNLDENNLLQENSSLHQLMEMEAIKEVDSEPSSLSNEVEPLYDTDGNWQKRVIDWLDGTKPSPLTTIEALNPQECPLECPLIDDVSKNEAMDLIDELFSKVVEVEQENQAEVHANTLIEDGQDKENVEAQQFIVFILPPLPEATQIEPMSVFVEPESDATSSSSSSTSSRKRPYNRWINDKDVELTEKDLEEKKKKQNVDASRRYRDKKKLEQEHKDGEVKDLERKNAELKQQLAVKEVEVKNMKDILINLGLLPKRLPEK